MIPEATVERTIQATDLVALVQRFVPSLKKQGTDWKGLCPFHNEKSPSFKVDPEKKFFKCFGCNEAGDAIRFLMLARKCDFPTATKELAANANIHVEDNAQPRKLDRDDYRFAEPESPPVRRPTPAARPELIDGFRPRKRPNRDDEPSAGVEIIAAKASFEALDDETLRAEAEKLGFEPETLRSLGDGTSGLGWHRGGLAYRYPTGLKIRNTGGGPRFLWVSGSASAPWRADLISAATKTVVVTEGESDAIAAVAAGIELDGETVVVASPGTSFVKEWAALFQGKSVVLAFDADEAGQAATKKVGDLLRPVVSSLRVVDWSVRPDGVKDLRALLIASGAPFLKQMLASAQDEFLRDFKTAGQLRRMEFGDDPNSMIGHKRRFLGRGGSMVIVGPSGIGKSTLVLLMAVCWAAGLPFFGIEVRRPLRILIVQAENDDGDLREMLDGAIEAFEGTLKREQLALVDENIVLRCETEKTGLEFCQWLEMAITKTGADLVLSDPLLSYVGDDISSQKVCSEFLRTGIQPILHRTGAMIAFVHHTGKTSSDPKSRSNWTESDGAYLGIGSSEITNWARAIATLVPASKDSTIFKFSLAKRGARAGMVSKFVEGTVKSLHLSHADKGLGWKEVEEPEEMPKQAGRKASMTVDDVLRELGPPSMMTEKNDLVNALMAKFGVKDRTVQNLINSLMIKKLIEVAKQEPRLKGGGHPITYLRRSTL